MVRFQLPLSGFRWFDFCEATIAIDLPVRLPRSVVVEFWGMHVMPDCPLDGRRFADSYLCGYGRLVFSDVTRGRVTIELYTDGGHDFLEDALGRRVVLRREWLGATGSEYGFGSVLAWPFGFVDLAIDASTTFEIEFDERQLRPAAEYVRDPERCGWPGGEWWPRAFAEAPRTGLDPRPRLHRHDTKPRVLVTAVLAIALVDLVSKCRPRRRAFVRRRGPAVEVVLLSCACVGWLTLFGVFWALD